MTYNIHPIIVHFPIALLFLYSVIKILPFKKCLPSFAWMDVERVLLFFGVVGAFVASSTGEIAEHLVRPDNNLVEAHEFFAGLSTWLYGLILAGEILAIMSVAIRTKIKLQKYAPIVTFFEKILHNQKLCKLLAFFGIISITITGMLGGVMVYGLAADPLAPLVLQILGITI